MGREVAHRLVSHGLAVFVGARDLARGEKAAAEFGPGATAVQLDVTDAVSIGAAAERIGAAAGRLDVLVNNAAIATTRTDIGMTEFRAMAKPSTAPLAEVRAVWEVNVFGVLAVYQAMVPLLRRSSDARIVNVTSALGSLTTVADPAFPLRSAVEPIYAGSKAALNAVTLTMMTELAASAITVRSDRRRGAGDELAWPGQFAVGRVAVDGGQE